MTNDAVSDLTRGPADSGADPALATAEVVHDLTRRLAVLGGASVALGGLIATAARSRPAAGRPGRPALAAFGKQTLEWGIVDLGIAGASVARAGRPIAARRLRRLLLVNSVLDVGYVAVGAYAAVRRPSLHGRLDPPHVLGHGTAIAVQGAALLLLDVVHLRRLS